MRGREWWWVAILMALSFLMGFSIAMALIGDSPWSEFWIDMARCCNRG